MPIPTSEAELAALFQELGAEAPEQWAHSQITENIPQLLRFLFIKNAWATIPDNGDTTWIKREIDNATANPTAPYAGLGMALARCKAKGVDDEDLTEIARCLKAQTLFHTCYLMDGPTDLPEALEDVSWGLFQLDDIGRPFGRKIGGLHESVLGFDPAGREMRPKRGNDE